MKKYFVRFKVSPRDIHGDSFECSIIIDHCGEVNMTSICRAIEHEFKFDDEEFLDEIISISLL